MIDLKVDIPGDMSFCSAFLDQLLSKKIASKMQPLTKTKQGNQSIITEFIFLDFKDAQEWQVLLFLVFLVICIISMAGNILVAVLVVADQHLHTPMYFFLGNLSCLETCYTSTILPRMLASFLTGHRTISMRACLTQMYFFGALGAAECYLLAAMSYDRYLAICKPLHYVGLMNGKSCLQLAGGSWIIAFLTISIIVLLISRLTFCGANEINHFFCDLTPVVKLACTDTRVMELTAFISASIVTLPPFLLTVVSYVLIIGTVLRIPSTTGKQRAFSTCSTHLIVVTIFYGTLTIVYVLPKTKTLRDLNKVLSLFYTVLTPLANPLIYSLRNKEVKQSLRKAVRKFMAFIRIQAIRMNLFKLIKS
ncbi:olfactory receptor 6F1-like [Alligator sinensis]|uniref:Olfactory receptor n=1 Tax=Alligator sinensis TaxID=38654 RepID=A0A3Q0FVJ9_ALLSI|nr:olfactory receptor 6F1-like [Alligator sinensis]